VSVGTRRPTSTRGVGASVERPDGRAKVRGEFAFVEDLHEDRMLWGATLRSPVARGRIARLEVAPALALPGVHAVLTQDDVPGHPRFGLEHDDQPVLADGEVRYWGEPIAVVAAIDEDTARRAAAAIELVVEPLPAQVDPVAAVDAGQVVRHVRVRRGDPARRGDVVVEGYYEVGSQDQAPLGPEAGLAVPGPGDTIDLWVPTQWVHADLRQIAPCLGKRPEQVRVHPGGVGGAFGAHEDVSLQIHLCLLAERTGLPVKMVYSREESFVGHVHRHPARMWFRHEATRDGQLVRVEASVLLDGGAYASTSAAVIANAAYFAVGPYRVPSVSVDGWAARTNNPPCGAMRGFGAVQACFGHESQMDRLAAALGMDPLELRLRNVVGPGDVMSTTGQVLPAPLPTAEVIRSLRSLPLPEPLPVDDADPRHLPGGTGLTTPRERVRRGVGYAVSIKNLAFSEGFDDHADARVVLTPDGVVVHTAAVEVGQGLVTLLGQIVRSVLPVEHVDVAFVDTSRIGSAGSTSASRQTQMTGGAVLQACEQVRDAAVARAGGDTVGPDGVYADDRLVATWEQLCRAAPLEAEVRFRHPRTVAPDPDGQGDLHADFAVAAHRAVVDVDPDLGLVRVVRVDTVQDVGRLLNPQAALGQVEGGIMQGVGLAVLEELVVDDGVIRNASFTDYLLPTFLDAPATEAMFVEEPGGWGPFGAKGIGEPPTISSTPAVVAAVRDATGRDLRRAPVRPEHVAGLVDLPTSPRPPRPADAADA
jgi:xanthine dehydrogenase D subunit